MFRRWSKEILLTCARMSCCKLFSSLTKSNIVLTMAPAAPKIMKTRLCDCMKNAIFLKFSNKKLRAILKYTLHWSVNQFRLWLQENFIIVNVRLLLSNYTSSKPVYCIWEAQRSRDSGQSDFPLGGRGGGVIAVGVLHNSDCSHRPFQSKVAL